MQRTASRQASMTVSKQSAGLCAASTMTLDSLGRPSTACSRSACSVLVGIPVDGPARCTSTITSGSSSITARFIASDLSAMPGPEVPVTDRSPANEAPMAAQMAAISSSA
jgi:hypothetical protein